jgi:hypothetical protein
MIHIYRSSHLHSTIYQTRRPMKIQHCSINNNEIPVSIFLNDISLIHTERYSNSASLNCNVLKLDFEFIRISSQWSERSCIYAVRVSILYLSTILIFCIQIYIENFPFEKTNAVNINENVFNYELLHILRNKGNNKITELRTILQRESQNS